MRMQLGARTQAVIVLALVATLGALVGILADRLASQSNDGAVLTAEGPPGPGGRGFPGRGGMQGGAMQPGSQRYAEWLANALELTPEQRAAIDSIVVSGGERVRAVRQELEPRLREIARETRLGIDQVLTAEQRQQLRTLRQDRARNLRPNPPRRGG